MLDDQLGGGRGAALIPGEQPRRVRRVRPGIESQKKRAGKAQRCIESRAGRGVGVGRGRTGSAGLAGLGHRRVARLDLAIELVANLVIELGQIVDVSVIVDVAGIVAAPARA